MNPYYQKAKELILQYIPFLQRHHTTRQFIKFCMVGVSNLVIDFTVYLFLTRVFGIYFIVANIGAFSVAISWSFYWNKRWTFQHEEKKLNQQYVKFIITNLVGIIFQTALLFAFVEYAGMYDIWAKILAVIAASVWNFLTTKFWAFK